jgi:multifunctional methyltransferase subunit TRM112
MSCHVLRCQREILKLTNVKLALGEADFNPDFLLGFLPKIEWDALIQASREVMLLDNIHHAKY